MNLLLRVGGLLGAMAVLLGSNFAYRHLQSSPANESSVVTLAVPYVSQVPDGDWVAPWDKACEEASLTMVQAFYDGKSSISYAEGKQRMRTLITWEDEHLQKNNDTSGEETVQIIENNLTFSAKLEQNPTLDEIKDELRNQRPVIALVSMSLFYPNPLDTQKDLYHVVVLNGLNETKGTFMLQDPAKEEAKEYSYTTVMNALRDYESSTRKATGAPAVIFTSKS